MKKRIIVFVKNPVEGEVKTRLGNQIGHKAALEVYITLTKLTAKACKNFSHAVYYSQWVDNNDDFKTIHKFNQQGDNLGDRMRNAFLEGFSMGYSHQILIGSDLPDLNSTIIQHAFEQLEKHEIVLGPARDGGYYLVGMQSPFKEIFNKVDWSTDKVLDQTLDHCKSLCYSLLKTRIDIDTQQDLEQFPKLIQHIHERTN
jgi:rSAM/selenodomain-associated transferase 1